MFYKKIKIRFIQKYLNEEKSYYIIIKSKKESICNNINRIIFKKTINKLVNTEYIFFMIIYILKYKNKVIIMITSTYNILII